MHWSAYLLAAFLAPGTLAVVCIVITRSFRALTRGKYRAAPRITWKGELANLMFLPEALMKRKPAFRKMTLKALKRSAAKRAKSDDFGDEWYVHGYEHAIGLINKQTLSPLGKFIAWDSLLRRLTARLRVKKYLKENPEATKTRLLPPVFVLGLPRTGTTFLHRLLSLDPNVRFPRTWELFDPAPIYPDDPVKDAQKKRKFVQDGIDSIKTIVPQIDAIHEIGSEEAEECLVSIGMDIPWVPCTFYLQTPENLDKWDWQVPYANHMKVLQMLAHNSKSEDRRWVLKCPAHLGFVKDIRAVFPAGTKIIWTHRNPNESLPSLCSLFQTFQEMHEGADIKLDELGQKTLELWSAMIKRADADFSASSANSSHVKYTNLVKDPVGTVKQVYSEFGWEYSDEYDAALKAYLEENRKEREKIKGTAKKMHSYSLGQYALTEAQMEGEFGWYNKKYL